MKKILIVEDELAYVNLLKQKLTDSGYKVFTAENGAEGLDTALKILPDLILLDIRMPVMDGMTMLEKLREDIGYGRKAKVILLTNIEPDESTIKKSIKSQPSYYLIKSDTNLSELFDAVEKLLADN